MAIKAVAAGHAGATHCSCPFDAYSITELYGAYIGAWSEFLHDAYAFVSANLAFGDREGEGYPTAGHNA
jgi:hypothetical protein